MVFEVARIYEVPDAVRLKALHQGKAGRGWLAALPGYMAALERRWSLVIGPSLAGGTTAFVADVQLSDGTPAVVKLPLPGGVSGEAQTLERASGKGYVRLLKHDPDSGAMLLERLGPPLASLGWPEERQIDALLAALQDVWLVGPPACTPPNRPGQKAAQLGQYIESAYSRLGAPCSGDVVVRALTYVERRAAAFDPTTAVFVHGDPNPWNLLRVLDDRARARSGFVFVDPEGFMDDRTYDLGVVLRNYTGEIPGDKATAQRYAERMAESTALDGAAIWEWGYVELTSSGLYSLECGFTDVGRRLLTAAELLLQNRAVASGTAPG